MRRWRRVDPWGLRQAFTGFLVLAGSALTLLVLVLVVARIGQAPIGTGLTMLGAVGLVTAWTFAAVRLYLVGIYRNDTGLLLRHIFTSRTLPWFQVTGFDVRAAMFLGGATVRDAAWVLTVDGAVESPVQRRSNLMGLRKNVGPVLSAADFDLMLARLREAHAAAQSGGGVVVR